MATHSTYLVHALCLDFGNYGFCKVHWQRIHGGGVLLHGGGVLLQLLQGRGVLLQLLHGGDYWRGEGVPAPPARDSEEPPDPGYVSVNIGKHFNASNKLCFLFCFVF